MKISDGAPHSAPWEEIEKSRTERLCAPMTSITLQCFKLVGHVIKEEIETEDFKRRAPTAPSERKSQDQGLKLCSVTLQFQLSRPRNEGGDRKKPIVDRRMDRQTPDPFYKVISRR